MDGGGQRGRRGLLRLVDRVGRRSGVESGRGGSGEDVGRRRGSALLGGLLDARSSTRRHPSLSFHRNEGEEEGECECEGEASKARREGV